MGTGVEWMAVAAMVSTAASTGIAVYSQQQQASNAERIANYNAQVQQQNALLQYKLAERQNDYQRKVIAMNQQVQQNNATMYRQQAASQIDQAQEEIRRLRDEKEAFLARQRAAYASAGVMMEGTPLAVLADTAGKFELQAADELYKADLQAREILYRGEMADYGAELEGHRSALLDLDMLGSQVNYRMAKRESELERMAGLNAAEGMRMQSYATLISGVSDMAGSYAGYREAGLFGGKGKPSTTTGAVG